MDEMTHRDSSLDAQQQPALDPRPKQHFASVPRSVILSIGVFVLCFAVLFAAPVLALRLMVSPADAVEAMGGPQGLQPDVRASAVVTTVVLQEGVVPYINDYPSGPAYAGTKDTYINQWEPTKNFANESRLVLGQSQAYRPLIYFDLGPASIPSNATIVDAQLGIYCNARNEFNSIAAEAYQVNRHWQLWQASWNKASSTENWTLEGCDHVDLDREGTPLTSTIVFDREAFHDFEITDAVQDWVSTPASNEGVVLIGPDPNVIYYYRNSRYSAIDERPRLVITWTIGAPAPTPTATPTASATPGPSATPTNTPTPTLVPGTETEIDDTSACYSHAPASGVWDTGTTGGLGGSYEYEVTVGTGYTARWSPCTSAPLPEDAMYRVDAHWSVHSARPLAVPYEIHYDGGTNTVPVNQTEDAAGATASDFSASGWYSLGEYPFLAGTNPLQYVELNTSSPGDTCADAVRWVQLPSTPGPVDTLMVTASPDVLPSDGASMSTIHVTVTDKYGALVADGTLVGVTTTLGTVPYAYVEAEDASVTTLGGWSTHSNGNASGGQYIRSNTSGDEVTWTFWGEAVSLVYRTNTGGGTADVSIDGVYQKTVDFDAAPEWGVERLQAHSLSSSMHVLRIRHNGGGWIWLDAFRSGAETTGGTATAQLTAPLSEGTATVGVVAVGEAIPGSSPMWPYAETTVTFPGPAEVWVDNDYCSSCGNDGHIWNFDAFDVIQDGVDKVLSGGTVHVLPGTYAESVTVAKPVSLLGAGSGVTVLDGVSDAPGSRGFYVNRADDVTISGFKVQDFETGVHLRGTGSGSGPRVHNARVVLNAFESNNAGPNSHAVYGTYVYTSTICSNDISLGYNGIYLEDAYGLTVCYNEIYDNTGYGITVNGGNNSSIDNNHIYFNQNVGIELAGATLNNGVFANTLHDLWWDGVLVNGSGASTVHVVANTIARTNLVWLDALGGAPDANHNLGGIALIGTTGAQVYDNTISEASNAEGNRADAAGISLKSNTAPLVETNLIEGCAGHGLHIPPGGGVATIHGNSIYSNGRFGLNNTLAANLHAEGNWWGRNTPTFGPSEPADVSNAPSVFWNPPISLTLSAAPDTIPADGVATSDIMATASGFGYDILDGTAITLTSDLSTLVFPASTAFAAGEAHTTLQAGTVGGVATVAGWAEPFQEWQTVNVTLTALAPDSIDIDVAPSSVPVGCAPQGQALVTATVRDMYLNPVAGIVVDFESDGLGSVAPAFDTTAAVTGEALTTFTPFLTPGTATVTATSGTTLTAAVDLEVTSGPPDEAGASIVAYPTSLVGNGVDTSLLIVPLNDCASNQVPDGTMVGFTTTLGSIVDLAYVEAESSDVLSSLGWSSGTTAGRTYFQTTSPGATAWWNFRGSAVSIIYRRFASGGIMRATIDGGAPVDIDTGGGGAWVEQVVATNLDPGAAHTIAVTCQTATVRLDAFRSGAVTSSGVATATLRAPVLPYTGTATVYATTRLGHMTLPELVLTTTMVISQSDIVWVDDDWVSLTAGTAVSVPGGTAYIESNAFDNIPDAVVAVQPGGTVSVLQGSYPLAVNITQTLHLLGYDGASSTFVEGSGVGTGVRVRRVADGASVEGFTIRDWDVGVLLDGVGANYLEQATIAGNVVTGCVTGAINAAYVNDASIAGNALHHNGGFGVDLDTGDSNEVMNNEIHDNSEFGVRLRNTTNAMVSYNNLHDLAWDGIRLGSGCTDTQVMSNTVHATNLVSSGSGFDDGGIVLNSTTDTIVKYNTVTAVDTAGGSTNTAGIFVDGNDRDAVIEYNQVLDNVNDGVLLWDFISGSPPVIRCNHIYGNVRFGLRNTRTTTVDATGNWWGKNTPTRGATPPKDIYKSGTLYVDWSPQIELTIVAAQPWVPAGGPPIEVTAMACGGGCCLLDGTPVTFTTDLGGLGDPPTSTVMAYMTGGEAIVMFTPGTVRGVATISAGVPDAGTASTTVTVRPLDPASIEVVADPLSIPVGNVVPSFITATVHDMYGNKVAFGTLIDFATTLGWTMAPTDTTSGGLATTTLHSGVTPGIATVSASWGIVEGTVDVEFTAGPPYSITSLFADPTAILANGTDTSDITAVVRDQYGNLVPDCTMVGFTTTAGSLIYDYVEAESADVVTSTAWTAVADTSASGDAYIRTSTVAAEAYWLFKGQAVSLTYRRWPSGGVLRVRVDGGPPMDIDASGAAAWVEQTIASGLNPAVTHEIRVACVSGQIRLDAFRSGACTSSGLAMATLTSQLLPPTTARVWATAIGGAFPVRTVDVDFLEPLEVWVDDDYCATCANDGHQWGFDAFDNIPDGVTAVREGGTVHVLHGTYAGPITVNKQVYLDGDGSSSTSIIEGTGTGNGILVTRHADGATIEGFLIRNFGFGVYLAGRTGNYLEAFTLRENVISGCVTGAITGTYVNDGYFSDNGLHHNSGFGFDLYTGDNNRIANSHIYENEGFGLRVRDTTDARITNNNVHDLDWDGIRVGGGCVDTEVLSNTVHTTNRTSSAAGFHDGGIVLNSTQDTIVRYNTVTDVGTAGGSTDTAGVWVGGNDRNALIEYNRLMDSVNDGVLLWDYNTSNPPALHCNHICGNGRFGLRNNITTTPPVVDAVGNWWGRDVPTRGSSPPRDIYRAVTPLSVDWNPPMTLSLVASPPTATAGGSPINVTLTGCDGGCCLLDGTPVTFTTDRGGFGSPPAPSELALTSGGSATVSFYPGTVALTATIEAEVPCAAVISTTVPINPGPPHTVTFLSVTPPKIWVTTCAPAGEPTTSTVRVRVTDQYGNPSVGATVNFSRSPVLGSLSASAVVLDSNGEGQTVLTAGSTAAMVTVQAQAGTASNTAQVEFMAGPPTVMTLDRSPVIIAADGVSTSTITATVHDCSGNLGWDGTMVGFTTNKGTLPFAYVEAESSAVTKSASDWTTMSNGNASGGGLVFTYNQANAGAWLNWTFNGSAVSVLYRRAVDGGTVRVYVDGVFRTDIDMSAASTEWQREAVVVTGLDPLVSHIVDVQVLTSGDPTKRVYVDAFRSGATTVGGVATAVLTSSKQNTTATVVATAVESRLPHQSDADRVVRSTTVQFRRSDLTVTKNAFPIDVPPEELVDFYIEYSNVGVAQATDTMITDTLPISFTYVSSASSPVLPAPTNPSDNVWVWQGGNVPAGSTGYITLTARRVCPSDLGWVTNNVAVGSLTLESNTTNDSATKMVNFTRGAPAFVTVTPDPISVDIDSLSTVRIDVDDLCGNPVPAATLYITTNLGAFAPSMVPSLTRTTNSNGRATVTFYSGFISGTATIDVTAVNADGSASGVGYVFIGVGPAEQCLATADPGVIPADGVSTSDISARVLDGGGNSVADGMFVGFTTTLGSLLYDYVEETEMNQSPPGSWTSGSNSSASGGAYLASSVDGASVYWSFVGNGVSVIYRRAPGAGTVDVSLDGNPLGPLHMAGGNRWRAERVFTWPGSPTAAHTLRLTHRTGTGTVYVDAFRSGRTTLGTVALAVLTSEQTVGTATVAATAVSETVGIVPELLPSYVDVRFDPADLAITKAVAPADFVAVGRNMTFTLQYQNLGPMTATLAYIEDTITDGLGPGWLTDIFFSQEPITVTPYFEYRWELGSLAPGAAGSIQFGGTVDPGRPWPVQTVITNTATIASSTVDLVPSNDTQSATVTVVADAPFLIDLVATPDSIPVGGAVSTLAASVEDTYGNPAPNGTPVTFTTSLGGFPVVQTVVGYTSGGVASVHLTSGPLVGTAFVNAAVDTISDNAQVVFTPLGPHTVTVTAVPDHIPVGGATSAIQAEVVDQYGNRVANGTLVAFSTSLGTIAPPSAVTTNGFAYSVLTSGTTAGTAVVTAVAGSASGTGTVLFEAGVARLTITADPVVLRVGEISDIRAVAKDAYGNNVSNGTIISFTTSLGYFTESSDDTTYQPSTGGGATAHLTSHTPGTAVVTAKVGAHTASVLVTFDPGLPHHVEILSVEPAIIEACEGTALARAEVTDEFGNRVRDGTVVVFDVTPQGDVEPIDGGRTAAGIAQAIISAGTVPGPATAWAWPEMYRTSVVDNYGIEFTEGPPDRVAVTIEPPLLAVGGNRATVKVRVTDCGGNPVEEGTVVSFTLASGGTLLPETTTTVAGWAYATLRSPNETGSATIRARAAEREGTAVVQYIPGPADQILLTADPLSIPADGASTSLVGAEVKDAFGNNVADRTQVVFSTDLGRFPTGLTYRASTLGGRASAELTSSMAPGIARVAASAAGRREEIFVDFYYAPTPTPPLPFRAVLPIIMKNLWRR